jgi:hypothetical protein
MSNIFMTPNLSSSMLSRPDFFEFFGSFVFVQGSVFPLFSKAVRWGDSFFWFFQLKGDVGIFSFSVLSSFGDFFAATPRQSLHHSFSNLLDIHIFSTFRPVSAPFRATVKAIHVV